MSKHFSAGDKTVRFSFNYTESYEKDFEGIKTQDYINYISYKHFSNEVYRESVLQELSKEVFVNNMAACKAFVMAILSISIF